MNLSLPLRHLLNLVLHKAWTKSWNSCYMTSTAENDTDRNIWGYFVLFLRAFSHEAGLPAIPKNDQNAKLPGNPKYKNICVPSTDGPQLLKTAGPLHSNLSISDLKMW